jgi:hypothetical protein
LRRKNDEIEEENDEKNIIKNIIKNNLNKIFVYMKLIFKYFIYRKYFVLKII